LCDFEKLVGRFEAFDKAGNDSSIRIIQQIAGEIGKVEVGLVPCRDDVAEAEGATVYRTANQGLTMGSRRARTDRSVTVTSAPRSSASSTLGQMACSSAERAVPSRPSLRIRITDGPCSPLVASREWKSASSVTQTRESARARRRI